MSPRPQIGYLAAAAGLQPPLAARPTCTKSLCSSAFVRVSVCMGVFAYTCLSVLMIPYVLIPDTSRQNSDFMSKPLPHKTVYPSTNECEGQYLRAEAPRAQQTTSTPPCVPKKSSSRRTSRPSWPPTKQIILLKSLKAHPQFYHAMRNIYSVRVMGVTPPGTVAP